MSLEPRGLFEMRLGKTAFYACVCAVLALAVVGATVASAATKPPKKKAVPAKLPMCKLGQATYGAKAVKCAANPLFAKTVCNVYLPRVQTLVPAGAKVATAGNRYGPLENTIGCYYTVNGTPQQFDFSVNGGASFSTNSLADPKKQINLKQAFEQEYHQWAIVTNQCVPQAANAAKTTVEGYEAFTFDGCPPTKNGVAANAGGLLEVLAGTTWVTVRGSSGSTVTSSSQLIPFAEQLIAKYH
jgi:hypothetical protein